MCSSDLSIAELGDRGYFKPRAAWSCNGGPLHLSTKSAFHAMCCLRRETYYEAGGYAPVDQSTDTLLEKALGKRRHIVELPLDQVYYVYRYGGATPGVPHNSMQKNAAVIEHGLKTEERGSLMLKPQLRADYLGMVATALKAD